MKDGKNNFELGKSKFVGKFPIRQNITVIPANAPKKQLIGWISQQPLPKGRGFLARQVKGTVSGIEAF